jgi:hypothetical protein
VIFNLTDTEYFHKIHRSISIYNIQGPKDFNFIFDIQNSISALTLRKEKGVWGHNLQSQLTLVTIRPATILSTFLVDESALFICEFTHQNK